MKPSFSSIPAVMVLALSLMGASSQAATTDISTSPLLVASPSSVKANLLFVLDDSGSMDWDYMPDHISSALCRSAGATAISSGSFTANCTRAQAPFSSSSFNGMAYNPATRYLPPVDASGVSYVDQTSANTVGWTSVRNDAYLIQSNTSINLLTGFPDNEWCTDSSFTNCLRNGNYVLPGTVNGLSYTTAHSTAATGTGSLAVGAPDAATTQAASWGPYYYNIVAAEYCDSDSLRNCQTTAAGTFNIPAAVRWCNSDANARAATPAAGTCQAVRTDVYTNARYPTKFFIPGTAGSPARPATPAKTAFTVNTSGCTSTKTAGIGTIVVNGIDLLGGTATALERYSSNLASDIVNGINLKTITTGFSASVNSSTVTITAPLSAGNLTATASFSRAAGSNASCTISPVSSAFSGYAAATPAVAGTPGGYSGSFERIDIVPSRTSYPRAATRSDCAGATCTYAEEMTNFANWWTYYHTRMQMMKSSASRAFAAVLNNRRVGYMSINNNTGSDFLNLDTFDGVQKTNWFSKLTHARPSNSTPLRTALATAGRLYAGKLNGTSLNGSTVNDPMLYSCQRNFTILSTDGFWNESNNPKQVDGSTDIGNQDSALARPKLDGNNTANALADVAAYYRNTDLRTGATGSAACTSGVSGADVCGNGDPVNAAQFMKTFTLGLGASGYMQFRADYLSATSGDFFAVNQGASPNASSGICTWQASGACNWPVPLSNTLTAIDDLWHAAVNGDGTYFSASDPTTLFTGLSSALSAIDVQTKASAAATTSNPNVSAGDNQIFVSNFSSGEWTGDLQSQRIDIVTGIVNSATSDWSARDLLDANLSRNIYMFSAGAVGNLKSFDWVNLSAAEKANFSLSYITTGGQALSQFCSFGVYCVSATDQALAAGAPLVNFLRGDRSNEGAVSLPARYFRARAHVLGDIVSSEAVYVKNAPFTYADAGYTAYQTTVANRQGMVYVGANDGMLHAFSSTTGQELWAYVPTLMLPKLYTLADKQYATGHQFFVDGTPTVQDVYTGGAWRTLLVGGLGAGGRGYYALDITDPAAPKALWEFTDSNLGLTMGKPEIGKLRDGTWAVFFGSGYNNVSPGDGHGRLYVVNAADGTLIRSIDTGAGNTTTPAGFAHIRAWVDNGDVDNTVQRVYGGDNLGNLWRFDVNNIVGAAGYDAQRLATLVSPAGTPQPVTSRPELGLVGDKVMVFVGTGRYLGQTDLSDATVQTIYAVKDRLDTQDFGDPRAVANQFVQQTIVAGTCPANTSVCTNTDVVRVNLNPQPVDLAINGGWYVDLPEARERVNTDPQLVLGTLVVNSNVIETGNVCKVGGTSYANFLDYRTGAPVSTAKGVMSVALGNAISTRPALIKLPNNKVISVSRLSDNRTISTPTPVELSVGATRRLSWRDLIQN